MENDPFHGKELGGVACNAMRDIENAPVPIGRIFEMPRTRLAAALVFAAVVWAWVAHPSPTIADQRSMGISPTQEDLLLQVGDRIFFDPGSSALTKSARATLDSLASWLAKHQNIGLTLEGHADEDEGRNQNGGQALSERRAAAAREGLLTRGVEAARLVAIGYGKARPAVLCVTRCVSQDRRVVFVIN